MLTYVDIAPACCTSGKVIASQVQSLQSVQTALQTCDVFLQCFPFCLSGFPIVVLHHLIEGCLFDTKVAVKQVVEVCKEVPFDYLDDDIVDECIPCNLPYALVTSPRG